MSEEIKNELNRIRKRVVELMGCEITTRLERIDTALENVVKNWGEDFLKDEELDIDEKLDREVLPASKAPAIRKQKHANVRPLDKKVREEEAKRGALVLEVVRKKDNGLTISVDRGTPFILSGQPARVFDMLIQSTDERGEPRSGWRTYGELAVSLEGKPLTKKIRAQIHNLIHRIKKDLRNAHVNENYLQTDRKLGVRFNLHKQAQVVIKKASA